MDNRKLNRRNFLLLLFVVAACIMGGRSIFGFFALLTGYEDVYKRQMFMLCARFMTSRVNVNNAICRRSVHEISFKRSAFDFMHSNRLCRWRYLLLLGEESMRACNINIHPSDSLTVLIKELSTRNPSISHSEDCQRILPEPPLH